MCMADSHPLDEQLCFALYSASRAATSAYRESLADLGLTYTQYVTLLALWERDGQAVSELGTALRLDSGTLSPLLTRMVSLGLVERRRESTDARQVTVHLTEHGHELEHEIAALQRRVFAAVDMTPDELSMLRSLARRFCDAASGAPADQTTTPSSHEGASS